MLWNKNKKKKVYPCKPQFTNVKVGLKGVYFSWTCYLDVCLFVGLLPRPQYPTYFHYVDTVINDLLASLIMDTLFVI